MFLPKNLAIFGPTASGKSALAVAVARALGGEVVSVDSAQIYRGMDVGTAKISAAEQQGVPHHMLDVADPRQPFSVADFVSMAQPVLKQLRQRNTWAVLAGGTGLYLQALFHPSQGSIPPDPAFRAEAEAVLTEQGAMALHARLAEADPAAAADIHPNNTRRVLRALEIAHITGAPMQREGVKPLPIPLFVLDAPSAFTAPRIQTRAWSMLQNGLPEETLALLAGGVSWQSQALHCVGYRQLQPFLSQDPQIFLQDVHAPDALARPRPREALQAIVTATNQYAKRQRTWARWRMPGAIVLDARCDIQKLAERILARLNL